MAVHDYDTIVLYHDTYCKYSRPRQQTPPHFGNAVKGKVGGETSSSVII